MRTDNVRYWHLADTGLCIAHVCLYPKRTVGSQRRATNCDMWSASARSEITKLDLLKKSGSLTDEEFRRLHTKLV